MSLVLNIYDFLVQSAAKLRSFWQFRSSLPSNGAEAAKFRAFDMQINFAIPPNSAFHGLLEEFFFIYQRYKIFNTLAINSLGKD